jgi:hypothetical protein
MVRVKHAVARSQSEQRRRVRRVAQRRVVVLAARDLEDECT